MNWLIWILIANSGIMFLEYSYRASWFSGFWTSLYILIIPILIGQLGLFYGFRLAPNLFLAGATFTAINLGLRIINSLMLGEKVGGWQISALVLMIVATIIFKLK